MGYGRVSSGLHKSAVAKSLQEVLSAARAADHLIEELAVMNADLAGDLSQKGIVDIPMAPGKSGCGDLAAVVEESVGVVVRTIDLLETEFAFECGDEVSLVKWHVVMRRGSRRPD